MYRKTSKPVNITGAYWRSGGILCIIIYTHISSREKKYLIFKNMNQNSCKQKYCLVSNNIMYFMRLSQCFEQVLVEILQFIKKMKYYVEKVRMNCMV